MDINKIKKRLANCGYIPRRGELIALSGLLSCNTNSKVLLLEGPPGCGKTALAESLVKAGIGSSLVYHLFHSWTDEQELFVGIDIASAVSGDSKNVRQDGVLAKAARISSNSDRPVIVCLDEIDKAPERVENLLLDWLQSGRVPVKPDTFIKTDLKNALVIITSNGQRELSDAFLRRCRRLRMFPLGNKTIDELISLQTNMPEGIVRMIRKFAQKVAEADGSIISMQELKNLALELKTIPESLDDVRLIMAGWAARGTAGHDLAMYGSANKGLSAIWAELLKLKRI